MSQSLHHLAKVSPRSFNSNRKKSGPLKKSLCFGRGNFKDIEILAFLTLILSLETGHCNQLKIIHLFVNVRKFYFQGHTAHLTSHVSQVFINIYRKSRENLKPKSSNFCNWELGPALNFWSFSSRNGVFNGDEKFSSVEDFSVCRCKRWDPLILNVQSSDTFLVLDVSPELWTILMRL